MRIVRNGIADRGPSGPDGSPYPPVRARFGLPADARLVLTVARLTEQKGHHDLLDAVPAVLARVSQAHFVWAGTGPLEGSLRRRIGARGLGGHVHLIGHCADVGALLAAAEVCVLPSLFEGLPLVVLEAMAGGVPVVGTRVCGTAEAVRDRVTGRLVPPRDPDALAAAMLEVLDCPERAARWGDAGKRRVRRHFSARRMARATAAVYSELLAPRTGAPDAHSEMPTGGSGS